VLPRPLAEFRRKGPTALGEEGRIRGCEERKRGGGKGAKKGRWERDGREGREGIGWETIVCNTYSETQSPPVTYTISISLLITSIIIKYLYILIRNSLPFQSATFLQCTPVR